MLIKMLHRNIKILSASINSIGKKKIAVRIKDLIFNLSLYQKTIGVIRKSKLIQRKKLKVSLYHSEGHTHQALIL